MGVNWRIKCLIAIIIPFSAFFLMSQNTHAQQINSFITIQYYYHNSKNSDWILNTVNNTNRIHLFQNTAFGGIYRINASGSLPTALKGSSFSGEAEIEIKSFMSNAIDGGFICPNLVEFSVQPEQGTITSIQSQVISCSQVQSGYPSIWKLKIQSAGNLSQSTTVSSFFFRLIGTSQKPIIEFTTVPNSTTSWYMSANVNFTMTTDQNTAVMGEINQNITNINNTIKEHNDKEQEALDNISNQTPSDISNAENQATTNLIGVLSSFLSQLTSFSATNCNLTLPFPNFIGGSKTVNICQGKDILGNFITIVGTLAMVAFYIPLAIVLLKMIYNEIRSFTNG